MKTYTTFTLAELAERFQLELQNCMTPHIRITGVGTLQTAKTTQMTFLENPAYRKYVFSTQASAVILSVNDLKLIQLSEDFDHSNNPIKPALLMSKNPYLSYAHIAELFDHRPKIETGIHPSAIIGKNCDIHPSACIGAYCVIGDDAKIGAHTVLFPHVTVYDETILGEHVTVHSGAVLGADGFGNARDGGKWVKVPQLGRVVVHDNVRIGANTTIDRGSLGDTVIEDGVKLDNQIQIAHNVRIGAHTAIAACTGIAGSAKIGKHCMIGGAVGINGHVKICDGAIITGMSSVTKSIKTPGIYSSTPAVQKNHEWQTMFVRLKQLDQLFDRVKNLENLKNLQNPEKP